MTQPNNKEFVKRLKKFAEDVKSFAWGLNRYLDDYEQFLISASQIVSAPRATDLHKKVDELARQAGPMKELVHRLIGERGYISDGRVWDPCMIAFNRTYRKPQLDCVNSIISQVEEAVGRLENDALISAINDRFSPPTKARPKVLIAHDGKSDLRTQLEMQLWQFGLEPLVVEEQPSQDESIDSKVNRQLSDCQFAVILGRLCRGNQQDGLTIPRGNIIDELARIRQQLGNNYIILLEDGLSLPTNQATGVIYESYSKVDFAEAILKVVKSLRHYNLI